ncbi:hypothetical protein BGZ81_000865, partial [Podila clonocystis]
IKTARDLCRYLQVTISHYSRLSHIIQRAYKNKPTTTKTVGDKQHHEHLHPTKEKPCAIGRCKDIDLTEIDDAYQLCVGAVDPGLRNAWTCVAMDKSTLKQYTEDFLQDRTGSVIGHCSFAPPNFDPFSVILAKTLDEESHLKRVRHRRNRKLAQNTGLADALQALSQVRSTMCTQRRDIVETIDSIRNALETVFTTRPICLQVYNSARWRHDQKHTRICRKIAYDRSLAKCRLMFKSNEDPNAPRHMQLPVSIIGSGFSGVRSRIRGLHRIGLKHMGTIQARYGIVGFTAEHNTTKNCPSCVLPMVNVYRVEKADGKESRKVVRGSKQCINPICSSVLDRRAVHPRDRAAAHNIGVCGWSELTQESSTTVSYAPGLSSSRIQSTGTVAAGT